MRVEALADAAAVAARGAAVLAECVREAVAARGRCVIAASGGKTPWAMYAALAGEAYAALPWERVHVVQVDERVAPAGHAERNLEGLRAALGEVARRVTLHAMPVEAADLEAAAKDYARVLVAVCGGDGPAILDVVHLGLGADGHTASLVPGDAAVEAAGDVAVTGVYQGRRRMTLTRGVLDRARRIVWVVTGADKVEAVGRLLAADGTIPAGRVVQAHALLLADRGALGRCGADNE